MTRNNRIWVLLLLCLGIRSGAQAQDLESLLVTADSANLELQGLYLEYQAALEVAPQVSQLPEPEAGLGLFVLPVETRLGPQWVRLSISQMFPWKGTRQARSNVALAMAAPRYEKIAAARLNLHYQIKTAYYQLYELDKKQQIIKDRIQLFKSLEALATTNLETGTTSMADVLRLQVRIRELDTELVLLENLKQKPRATLQALLNFPDNRVIEPADTLVLLPLPYNRGTLLDSIRGNHPMLRIFELQQEAARQTIALNALEGKPSIGVGLDYIAVGKRSDASPEHNGRDILGPRVSVRVPIYRDKYHAREQEERLKILALETQQQQQYLQFRSTLDQAFADYEDGRLKFQLYQEQEATLESTGQLLLTDYSTSGRRFVDLLQLEDQLLQYQLRSLSAVVQTRNARAAIERFRY